MFTQAAQELTTVRDILRFAVSRFNDAGLFFGHGSDNAHDEAAFGDVVAQVALAAVAVGRDGFAG